jgi:translation initiation factor 5A
MSDKYIDAYNVRPGSAVIIDGAPCVVKNVDISKTGKHGASKARIEAVGIVDGKKRIIIKPGHEKLDIPHIEKKRGQILSITNGIGSVMDLESFETVEVKVPEECIATCKDGSQVEYWNVEGLKIIKRIF